jgi:hypothetical protein
MHLNIVNNSKQYKFTFIVLILILIVATWYGNYLKKWKNNEIINNDVIMYYAYLPATFIYDDITFGFTKNLPPNFEGRIWTLNAPNGKQVLKMSCGNAICWIPFFGIAHLYALNSDKYEANGYSVPYSFSIFIAALFYLGIGLFYLGKLLLRYFHDFTVGIALFLIVLATNLLYYVIQEPGLSHVISFGLISAFLYFSIKWLDAPTYMRSIIMGLLAGLITLIRPTNFIVLLLPVLIGISNWSDIYPKIQFLWNNKFKIIIMGLMAFVVFIPQLVYWKYIIGQYVYYSYQDQSFFFSHPHIIDGLFSYRKGWLLYTPIMVFAIIGFLILKKYARGFTFAFSVFMLINVYLIFSWWCWWYGGSFGSRPMIDSYGIMAFPLAALVEYSIFQKKWIKYILGFIFIFILYLNQFQLFQYRIGIFHWDSMSKELYWSLFLTKKTPSYEKYQKMLQPPNIEKAMKGMAEN